MFWQLGAQSDPFSCGHEGMALHRFFENGADVEWLDLYLESFGGLIGEELLHKGGDQFCGARDVDDERRALRRDRTELPLEDDGAHVNAGEMISEIVCENAEHLIFVLREVAQILTRPQVERPNGIQISPDDKTLYLIEANGAAGGSRLIRAYELAPDGTCYSLMSTNNTLYVNGQGAWANAGSCRERKKARAQHMPPKNAP